MENIESAYANDLESSFIRRIALGPWLLSFTILAFCSPAMGRQRQAVTTPQQDFNQLATQATKARESDRLDEAIALYRKAVGLRPKWDEGWWYLATLLYDRDHYAEAVHAFKKAAELQPKVGTAWGMLGLCEYQLGRYPDALNHIQHGRKLGFANNRELGRAMLYHEGLLLLLKGEFEVAQQTLDSLSFEGLNSEGLILALGLSVLRMPILLKDINANDRELIRRAGWAEHLSSQKKFEDAQREYAALAKDFPKVRNVQYAYGRYLLVGQKEDEAIEAFKREIENSPEHAQARLQIAYLKLKNKDAEGGLPFAEQVVKLYPDEPLGHYMLGRLLFDAGQNARAIEELEITQRMLPDVPKVYFALARAYARANRQADAERARATFTRLNKLAEESTGKGAGRSEAFQENTAEGAKPTAP